MGPLSRRRSGIDHCYHQAHAGNVRRGVQFRRHRCYAGRSPRQCAADAANVALALHADAEAEIRARFIDDPKGVTPQRLEMGTFPAGSNIIPNPVNRIPGFNYRNIYFLPGFPQMAWPMMQWVLDTQYSSLFDANRIGEAAIIVREAGESLLIDLMRAVQGKYPALKIFSLPRMQPERFIELGARGDPAQVAAAITDLKQGVTAMKFPWTDAPSMMVAAQ